MADESKSPIDQAVELFVYAPIGLALTARENLPDLIAKGRTRVVGQVQMARMIGQFAVTQGEREARKRVEELAATLADLGVVPSPPQPPAPPRPPTPAASATESSASQEVVGAPETPRGNGRAPTPPSPPPPASDHLAIPGYDTLSASQVVQRLAGLAPGELEAVREYESATRGRRTILSKVAQLQAGSGS